MDVESYTDGISFNYPKEKMFIFLSLHILINIKNLYLNLLIKISIALGIITYDNPDEIY